jgi:polyisoprenoid-binding protein YceI
MEVLRTSRCRPGRGPGRLTRARLALLCGALLSVAAPAAGERFEILPDQSRVRFSVSHHDFVRPVKGRFASLAGTIDYDAAHPEDLEVEVEIDARSVDTDNGFRDEHLRTSFFETATFPTIRFELTRVLLEEEAVEGMLTMKGVSRPVRLQVSGVRDTVDAHGVHVLRCRAEGRVNRRDFGVEESAGDEDGLAGILGHIQRGLDEFISDEVEVEISVVARTLPPEIARERGAAPDAPPTP